MEEVLLDCIRRSAAYLGSASLEDRLIDAEIDSLRFIQLVVLLENKLELEFEDKKLNSAEFERFGDILSYMQEIAPHAA